MEEYRDFTYDKTKFAGLPEFVDDLHSKGMHYVLMIVSFPFAIVYRSIYFFFFLLITERIFIDVFVCKGKLLRASSSF